jgi:FlaG/FlaF family flagellin (archaellin)
MKTDSSIACPPLKSRAGSAVIVILILLTIMVVLAAANTATLNRLRQRMKIVAQRQTQRLNASSTNWLNSLKK